MKRATLAEHYWPLVQRIARSIHSKIPPHPATDLGDLEGHGGVALVEAEQAWREDSGVRFPAYAYTAIQSAIIDAVRKSKPLSSRTASRHRELVRTREMLAQLLGRTPTPVETAEALGVTHQELAELERAWLSMSSVSMDARTPEGGTLADNLGSDDSNPASLYEHAESITDIRRRVANLDERTRRVIAMHYGENLSYREIALVIGVNHSRVQQIINAALDRMRADEPNALEASC